MPMGIELDELIDPTGASFSLNNGRTRAVLSEAGGGTPPITYLVSRGPLQDGVTLRGFRLDPRVYLMLVRWQGCSRDQYWQYRARLLDYVRPNRQTIGTLAPYKLRKYLIVGGQMVKRDLYVMIESGPEFAARIPTEWDEQGFSETLRWVAHDPTWYDAEFQTEDFIPDFTDNLIFPITFPIVFGVGVFSGGGVINYTGTWAAYPTITIHGPASGIEIRNLTTGELIALEYTIPAGDYAVIDLAYGAKTVVDSSGANLIGYLTDNSDLATWHIEPAPSAPNGDNTITIVGSGGSGSTVVYIQYQRRWYGL